MRRRQTTLCLYVLPQRRCIVEHRDGTTVVKAVANVINRSHRVDERHDGHVPQPPASLQAYARILSQLSPAPLLSLRNASSSDCIFTQPKIWTESVACTSVHPSKKPRRALSHFFLQPSPEASSQMKPLNKPYGNLYIAQGSRRNNPPYHRRSILSIKAAKTGALSNLPPPAVLRLERHAWLMTE